MNAKIQSSLELMRFGRSVKSALLVIPLSWRLSHYVVFLTFLLFSFAYNDLVDRKMDVDGHPDRPLPSGRLTVAAAATICLGLLLAGSLFAYVCADDLLKIFIYASAASATYSWVLKRHMPLIATPVWSLTVTVVVCLPAEITGVGWAIFFLVLYIHEVLLDMRDEKSDRVHCTTPSIATLLGKNTWCFVFFLVFVLTQLLEGGYAIQLAPRSGGFDLHEMLKAIVPAVPFTLAASWLMKRLCIELCSRFETEGQTDWVAEGIVAAKRTFIIAVLLI